MAGRNPDCRVIFVEDNDNGRKTRFEIAAAWKNGESNNLGIEVNIGLPPILDPHTKLALVRNTGEVPPPSSPRARNTDAAAG